MIALSTADRDKFAKICGIFGSDHAGERAAAALKAATLHRERNVTWPRPLSNRFDYSPESSAWAEYSAPTDWRADIHMCERNWLALTDWEKRFAISSGGRRALSTKQEATLADITGKLRARGFR